MDVGQSRSGIQQRAQKDHTYNMPMLFILGLAPVTMGQDRPAAMAGPASAVRAAVMGKCVSAFQSPSWSLALVVIVLGSITV